jgi:hypothetical protein
MESIRERSWPAVILTPITVSGDKIIVSDTSGLHPKQQITINAAGQEELQLEIKRILSETAIQVGPSSKFGNDPASVRKGSSIREITNVPLAYSGGTLAAGEQGRTSISSEAIFSAIYAEEPTVALRTVNVDYWGRYIDSVLGNDGLRRLAVDADVTLDNVDVDIDWPKTPVIINVPVAAPATETAIVLPANMQRFSIKVRDGVAAFQIAFIAGQSGTNFVKVSRGAVWNSGEVDTPTPFSVYVQVDKAPAVIEVMAWTYL